MHDLRRWSVRHARSLERVYAAVERGLVALAPLFERIGWTRVERPVRVLEKAIKVPLFGCRMCGQCILSSTGMSCPMNCPKTLRNGPCGGVRPGGYCEVIPTMRCVWVEAWEGAARMRGGEAIHTVQFAVDHRLAGSSSWLRVARESREARTSAPAPDEVTPLEPLNAGPGGRLRGGADGAAATGGDDARAAGRGGRTGR